MLDMGTGPLFAARGKLCRCDEKRGAIRSNSHTRRGGFPARRPSRSHRLGSENRHIATSFGKPLFRPAAGPGPRFRGADDVMARSSGLFGS